MTKVVDAAALTTWIAANQYDVTITPPIPPPATTGPVGVPGNWNLVFEDTFDTLDTANWTANWLGAPGAITPPINSSETCAYDPAQVSVAGGQLQLALAKRNVTVGGKTYAYASGIVTSHGKKTFPEGCYVECSMTCPAASNGQIANWPAVWTNGENWPDDGECDIMEGLGGSAAYHFHSPAGGPGKTVAGNFTGKHVYGALRTKDKATYYYDGVNVGSLATGMAKLANHYLILNHGIGQWGGPLLVPSVMSVDWVRVWVPA